MEEWRTIPGFEKYEISTLGRVRHIRHKRILKYNYPLNGYPQVGLSKNGKKTGSVTKCVHQLMILTFIGQLVKGTEINHKDGNRANPVLANLEIFPNKKEHMKLHRKRPIAFCYVCGEECSPRRSQPNGKKHYCSSICRHEDCWIDRRCVVCGVTITLRKSEIRRSEKDPRYHNAGKYCSQECYGVARAGIPNLHHFKYKDKQSNSLELFSPGQQAMNE